MKRNPVKKDPRFVVRPRQRIVAEYLDPLRNLRSIGIDPAPGFDPQGVRSVQQIPLKVRAAITRAYKDHDAQFSRPHIVADFSLRPSEVQRQYAGWKRKTVAALKRDGFSPREITQALRGTQAQFLKRVVARNQFFKREAQRFAGQHPDPSASGVVIPVISGDPQKSKLKFDKHGRPFLIERGVVTQSVPFDPVQLAKGKRKYLERVLAPYKDNDRFFLMMGDTLTIKYSSTKSRLIDTALRLMNRYQGAKAGEHHWKHWMLGIRVLTGGNQQDLESARQQFAGLKRRMAEQRRIEKDRMDAIKMEHRKGQARDRQRRKRVRDKFIF